jgi:hypothetical protein
MFARQFIHIHPFPLSSLNVDCQQVDYILP